MTKIVLALVTLGLMTGCGQKPLTQEQTQRMTATFASLNGAATVVQNAAKAHGSFEKNKSGEPAPAKKLAFDLLGGFAANAPTAKDAEPELEEMKSRIDKALTAGDCKLVGAYPDTSKMPKFDGSTEANVEPLHLAIEGSQCPIALDFTLTPTGTTKNGVFQFKILYAVADDSLKKISEIDRLDLSGKFQTSSDMPNLQDIGDRTQIPSFGIKNDAVMEASFHTRKEGDVRSTLRYKSDLRMEPSAKQAGMDSELVFMTHFSDFTAEVTATGDVQGRIHYKLNGEEKTGAEIMALFSGLLNQK